MNILNWIKRQPPVAPPAVIQAACEYYGLSPEQCPDVQTERVTTLSKNAWIVKIDEQAQALVAYTPQESEPAFAVAWYAE